MIDTRGDSDLWNPPANLSPIEPAVTPTPLPDTFVPATAAPFGSGRSATVAPTVPTTQDQAQRTDERGTLLPTGSDLYNPPANLSPIEPPVTPTPTPDAFVPATAAPFGGGRSATVAPTVPTTQDQAQRTDERGALLPTNSDLYNPTANLSPIEPPQTSDQTSLDAIPAYQAPPTSQQTTTVYETSTQSTPAPQQASNSQTSTPPVYQAPAAESSEYNPFGGGTSSTSTSTSTTRTVPFLQDALNVLNDLITTGTPAGTPTTTASQPTATANGPDLWTAILIGVAAWFVLKK
jgi:hypothetical protein